MIQINIGDHVGSEHGDPFTPILFADQNLFRWARTKAVSIAKNISNADAYFSTLPRGRSLTDLLNDRNIWINYSATTTDYGFTYGNNDLWVGPLAIRMGRWTILATIIHELAHINGAGGVPSGWASSSFCRRFPITCNAAERAVYECGLGNASEATTGVDDPRTPYNPSIRG